MNKTLRIGAIGLLAALAGCGSSHPLAGHWREQTKDGGAAMTIEFDAGSDRVMVHTRPDAKGHHDHADGTYTFDAEKGALVVRVALLGAGQPDSWAGELHGEHLHLRAGETELEFARGGDPHGH